ncbi:hypothetical protein EVAR_66529_1 [Eumeta japonica]|uniref:Uncharacterized protein n=1 Tax=Eumeta variegata TaxID=151549 RepID=A0A4C1ZCG0_EUMVA|nr:hypothetical protein EVAR_66529_1 [Eumeta japonica]
MRQMRHEEWDVYRDASVSCYGTSFVCCAGVAAAGSASGAKREARCAVSRVVTAALDFFYRKSASPQTVSLPAESRSEPSKRFDRVGLMSVGRKSLFLRTRSLKAPPAPDSKLTVYLFATIKHSCSFTAKNANVRPSVIKSQQPEPKIVNHALFGRKAGGRRPPSAGAELSALGGQTWPLLGPEGGLD